MDPVISALLSSPVLGGLGAFALAGSFVALFYWLSVSGRLFTKNQHESVLAAVRAASDKAISTLETQHAILISHYTDRNKRLEGLFDAQQEVIKSQQLSNATKNDIIAEQTRQLSQLMVVAGTVDDIFTRVPRREVTDD